MRLAPDRIEVRGDVTMRVRDVGAGPTRLGPIEVDVGLLDEVGWAWEVANRGDEAVALDAVAIVLRLHDTLEPVRMFRHGYQSWSPTGVATFGVDSDPSRADGAHWLAIDTHHADPTEAWPGELRSELVTAIRDANGELVVAGFLGGWEHDGTFRLRPATDGSGAIELWVEAYLGGAVLESGEARSLHAVMLQSSDDASEALARWAGAAGAAGRARVDAPYQVGWCSWYHYFGLLAENDVRHNLKLAADWPFTVFQIDDGYQRAIGDWLATNERFPSSLDHMAADIAAAGLTPGIWLAPFLVAPRAAVAAEHPEWVASHGSGRSLIGAVNDGWGGAVHVLDTTLPEVQAHLEATARALVDAGFTYLKLDFTYAPGFAGRFADRSRTPAQRVRAGFDAVRRGAGERAFLLGCGAPLGTAIGVVDGMRIGPDVAPWWDISGDQWRPAGYEGSVPSTLNAWRSTLARSFQHRRLWLNDPDCVMLRTDQTALSAGAAHAWALAVGVSGGMALVSDDLGLLGVEARSLFDDVVELGRTADAAARGDGGEPPRCPDLLDASTPARLQSGTVELVGDPGSATAVLQERLHEVRPR